MGFPDRNFDIGFSLISTILPILFVAFFVVFIVIFIIGISRGIKQNRKNNASPVLKVDAVVVAKRFDVRHNNTRAANDNIASSYSSHTTYYVTFQVESGDRMEFNVHSNEYGMLIEHDKGKLTFQGTRYLGFERSRN